MKTDAINRRVVIGAGAAGLAACAAAAQPGAETSARATVTVAAYRHNDVLWENDRTAHRVYARALEAVEPPSGSGIDAWGKRVRVAYMERTIQAGNYHLDRGEGADFYNVGASRGCGGLGVWFDNKLWCSRNAGAVRILRNGPDVAEFEVDYAPWPVDVARRVWETRRFTLPMGSNFTHAESVMHSDSDAPLIIGVGLARKPNNYGQSELTAERAHGLFSAWGPEDPAQGSMGVAILIDPGMIAGVTQDADNYLALLNVTPGQPFVYYLGAGWDRGLDFASREDWETYVRAQRPDFTPGAG